MGVCNYVAKELTVVPANRAIHSPRLLVSSELRPAAGATAFHFSEAKRKKRSIVRTVHKHEGMMP